MPKEPAKRCCARPSPSSALNHYLVFGKLIKYGACCTAALGTRPSTMLRVSRVHKFPTCVRSSSTTALSGTVSVQAPAGMTDAIDCPQVVQSASSATRSPLGHRWHALRLSPLSAPCQLPCWLAVCHQPPFTSQLAAQDLVCVRACVCLHMYSIRKRPLIVQTCRETYLIFQVPDRPHFQGSQPLIGC